LRAALRLLIACAVALAAGCRAERLMRISSDPPRAEVRIDGQRYGVTPLDVPFDYYGHRRVTLYLDGFRTWSKVIPIEPRWYGYFPLDIVTEVLVPVGWTDIHEIYVELEPGRGILVAPDVQAVLDRAQTLRRAGPDFPHVAAPPPVPVPDKKQEQKQP
jgi:hypothetical protein